MTPTTLIATARGMVPLDELTRADIDFPRWIIPVDEDAVGFAHINLYGVPLCGAALTLPHRTDQFRCGRQPCQACQDAPALPESPQMVLFAETAR